jgi:flagellar biosynthesis anti-sigma factor FlgM
MMDPIVNKSVLLDPSVRKNTKSDVKSSVTSLSSAVSGADASTSQSENVVPVSVTISKGNGLSEPPFDYAKVIALKQSIANGEYKIDYGKLADAMVGADILNPGNAK